MFKLSFKQQVLIGFAVSLAFVLLCAISSYLSIKNLNKNTAWQEHSYQVIDLTRQTEVYVLNAETSLRGLFLTDQKLFVEPYQQNVTKISPTIDKLRKLVDDNPEQLKNVDSLAYLAELKIVEMRDKLTAYDTKSKQVAIDIILKESSKLLTIKTLSASQNIINAEVALLNQRKVSVEKSSNQAIIVVIVSACIIFLIILVLFSYIRKTFDQQKETENKIRENNIQLERLSDENSQKNWLLSGVSQINESIRGVQNLEDLSNNIITGICSYINAPIGAIFLNQNQENRLKLFGTYAYPFKKSKDYYEYGDGIIGQVAIDKKTKLLTDIPQDYIKVNSGLGNTPPQFLIITPIIFEQETIAVIEIGFNAAPAKNINLLLDSIMENVGIAINSALANITLKHLLEQTKQQAEELEAQQEELRTTNEELQASEEELRVQQEELQQTNTELEEKAQLLEEQNTSIQQAREAISIKANELELSSKYKSEFLANMSHELRTPLNSILILARILKDNKPENLTTDQVKYAGVIHNAGTDLLNLINDILDLSKIESGKIDLSIEAIAPLTIKQDIEELFSEVALNKSIDFSIDLASDLPITFKTDLTRLEQIVKNLLSNAFKFTPAHGSVSLNFGIAKSGIKYYSNRLNSCVDKILSLEIKDNGIGIPAEKQKVIFEAFQQADGSTSRKYGGTGLGLSISKELANILGGEIQITSEHGYGSTFTLYIPENLSIVDTGTNSEINITEKVINEAITFTQPIKVNEEKNTILIVEDDLNFAEILKDYAIEKGFSPLLAHSGDVGLDMAISNLPDAIILDIMLPVMDGWTILKKLKSNPITKHIPVHMMSAGDEKVDKAQKEGAIGFLKKPIGEKELEHAFDLFMQIPLNNELNTILLIEDQETQSNLLTQQLIEKGVKVTQAFNGDDAISLLAENTFDCIILDLNLPDISGFDLLDKIKSMDHLQHVPVVINTAMELQKDQMDRIMHYSEAMILKSDKSNDRLIDEVSLFMSKIKSEGKTTTHSKTNKLTSTLEKALKDKKILVTDDDMRNIFALSTALQAYDMQIVIANNGREALEKLAEIDDIDLVLMDIMMPEMDGYEAMKAIRKKKEFAKLPIIALTAKAMKNDREKCIEAGANDYISKPIDVDELLSMIRVWLSN